MNISVELTLTPIQDDFEPAIINFISGLTVKENSLRAQVYGDYDQVMDLLKTETKTALEAVERGLMYIKIVKSDRSGYEPHF